MSLKVYNTEGELVEEISSPAIEGKLDDLLDETKETNTLLERYLRLIALHLAVLSEEDFGDDVE